MTADPQVQYADDLQNYNRYSYVHNNPLGYVDPSGYGFFKKLFAALFAPILDKEVFRTAVSITAAYFVGYNFGGTGFGIFGEGMGFANSLAGGFTGGTIQSGNLQGGLQGAFSAALFYQAGFVGAEGSFERIAAHAAAGCISGAASGGDCGSGAMSAGFANWAGQFTQGLTFEGQLVAKAVIGGTASAIGGGKFANGAMTGAFGHLFNDGQKEHDEKPLGAYLPGTEAGDNAAMYWAARVNSSTFLDDPAARVGLSLSVLWTPDTAVATGLTLVSGGAASLGVRWGGEISIGSNFRIAPFGNRTGNPLGELPHYHRRVIDFVTGQTKPGQGIGRHRPWETKSPDKSFRDRF